MTLIAEALRNRDASTKAAGFTVIYDTLIEGGPSETQPFDVAGTSSTSTPPQTTTKYLSMSRSVLTSYMVITQAM